MTSPETDIRVDVGILGDSDAREIDELAGRLHRELLQLDVEAVERVSEGVPPEGARAIDVLAIGSLVVKIASSGAIPKLVGVLRRWMAADDNRTLKLQVGTAVFEAKGVSPENIETALTSFLQENATQSGR